ncbi:hypothetical protein PINS_up007058 [Pythium insidiosum]|nr:hypothetical protein PINS_up007058 [Pythium insidiosum]
MGAVVATTMLWTLSMQLPRDLTTGVGLRQHRSVASVRRVRVGDLEDIAVDLYPERLFSTDWRTKVQDDELFHLGVLHRACMALNTSVIPWNYGLPGVGPSSLVNETDAAVVQRLRQCPDIDVFLPSDLHGHGYCEDAVAYTKYLRSRMLPSWVFRATFTDPATGNAVRYHDLCPHTPVVVFNRYWDGIVLENDWPKHKKVFVMPNIEMGQLVAKDYWAADVILCKTAICARYLHKWMRQQGNPNGTKVFFTRHVSSDATAEARAVSKQDVFATKNFDDVVFTHVAGKSIHKGTTRILDCWFSRPDFPTVNIYMGDSLYNGFFKGYQERIATAKNIQMAGQHLDAHDFSKVIADASFFLCASTMEGYGHYINQARAAGGLIISTDVPPMNELVTPSSGVLIPAKRSSHPDQLLSGGGKLEHSLRDVVGYIAEYDSKGTCDAVEQVLRMTASERRQKAERAYQQYLYDVWFFAQRMKELRAYARGERSTVETDPADVGQLP